MADIETLKQSYYLPYGLFFLFSWMVELSFGYRILSRLTYVLVLFFFLLLLHYLTPTVSMAIIVLLTVLSSLYLPVGRLFGPINYNNLISTLYTTPSEIRGFLVNIPAIYYLGSIILLLLGGIISLIPLTIILSESARFFMLLFIGLHLIYKPIKQLVKQGKIKLTAIAFTPLRFLLETYSIYQNVKRDHQKIKLLLALDPSWRVLSVQPQYRNYILVIGESVRKDFMHTFGFSIPNTPFASRSPGLFFDNYLAAGSATVLSLTHTLAQRTNNQVELQNNIITLAKQAGFYTYWLSNQDYLGEYDTPISAIGKYADCPQFLKTLDPIKFKDANDEALLPFIQTALTDTSITQPKLMVVHLLGSHPPCSHRTNGQFAVPFHSKQLSCYVQSIRNTDRLLETIVTQARATQNEWSMLYFSDHGLSLENGFFGHNDQYQESYRVPLFIISSNHSRRENLSAYRSAFYFLNLFSEWLGIQEASLQSNRQYISNLPYLDQNNIILANKKIINIEKLNRNIIA